LIKKQTQTSSSSSSSFIHSSHHKSLHLLLRQTTAYPNIIHIKGTGGSFHIALPQRSIEKLGLYQIATVASNHRDGVRREYFIAVDQIVLTPMGVPFFNTLIYIYNMIYILRGTHVDLNEHNGTIKKLKTLNKNCVVVGGGGGGGGVAL
jgi:hypothetical protein